MFLLTFYRFLTWVGTPGIVLLLWKRRFKGKEDPKRFSERMGYASLERPVGELVWIHAASVGESLSAISLIQRMREVYPAITILITTGTVTSAQLLATRLPVGVIHQYVPVDIPHVVSRFLRHWKPNLALWLESEFWPNLVVQTRKVCPMILVNARVTERAARRWVRWKSLCQLVVGSFDVAYPQTELDAERLRSMGARRVEMIGNLKYDAPPLPDVADQRNDLLKVIGKRVCWAAVSTHEGEEEYIIQTHKLLKIRYPEILTILVPRHANRGNQVRSIIESSGLTCAQRSKHDVLTSSSDIYLADTLGELGIFFRISPITFVGGSFVAIGGHNPLEPARIGSAVLFGPSMYNFSEIAQAFLENQGAIQVSDAMVLASEVQRLLSDGEARIELTRKAKQIATSHTGTIDHILKCVETYCGGKI